MYSVYRIQVGNHFYYGRSKNPQARLTAHQHAIKKLVREPKSNLYVHGFNVGYAINFHIKAAKFLRQKKYKGIYAMPCFSTSICFESDCLNEVKEVEVYLIKMSFSNKFCHNIKTSK